jgi:hypothetical protein
VREWARLSGGRWQGVVACCVALAGLAAFYRAVATHDPPAGWIVWRYLLAISLAALWGLSALAGGHALWRRLGLRRPFRESLVLSFALGVAAWALLIVFVGLLGVLGKVTFVAMPLLFLGVGGLPLLQRLRRMRRLKRRLTLTPASWFDPVVQVFGVVCVGTIWVQLLTPRSIMYDARWYHLPLAEQYAATGHVFRLDEGWFNGAMPHLASYLQTWSFLTPFGQLFDRLALAQHLELVVFIGTLASLPVLVDVLLPRPRLRGAWVARFLFPGVLLYDSTLGGGADHVLAFWAVPLVLAFRHAWVSPSLRAGLLFGVLAGGAAATKYQAIFLLAGPGVALVARVLFALVVRQHRAFLGTAGMAVVGAAVVSSPHWALNAAWHHNPVYPYLSGVFPSTPMEEGIEPHITEDSWQPKGTLTEKLLETAKASLRFGFEAHDWESFHGKRPVFGTLFLIALALSPFALRRRRVVALGLATWLAVPLWYWTQHQDRYLQAIAPWCAVVVVVVGAGVWRRSKLARAPLAALAALQLLHTADLPVLPANSILHAHPLTDVLGLLASNDAAAPEQYVDQHFSVSRAARLLPADAKVLVHEVHIHLGLQRAAVRDNVQRQGAIVYHALGDTGSVVRKLKSLGVTHVLWNPTPMGLQLIGDDLVFLRFVQHAVPQAQPLGDGFFVGAIGEGPAPREERVLVLTCTTEHLSPRQLQKDWHRLYYSSCAAPPQVDAPALAVAEDIVIVDTRRYPGRAPLDGEFTLLFDRNGFNVWSRNSRR